MKKYILCVLLIMSVLANFLPVTFAAGNDYTLSSLTVEQNLVYSTYELSAELSVTRNSGAAAGTMFLAFYADNGLAAGIKYCNLQEELSLSDGQTKTYSTGVLTFDKQVTLIKAMVWNDEFIPSANVLIRDNIQLSTATHYAIAECYNDVSVSGDSSAYDFIDVMSFDGEAKKIYIDNTEEAMSRASDVIKSIKGASLNANGVDNLVGIAPDKRVIEYTVKKSNETVYDMNLVQATTFNDAVFSVQDNKFTRQISDSETVDYLLAPDVTILDATEYFKKGSEATAADYTVSSVSEIYSEIYDQTNDVKYYVKYAGFLIQPNSNGQYEHFVFTWFDYKTANFHMLSNLNKCSLDLQVKHKIFPVGNQRSLIMEIWTCIKKVIIDAETNIIDKDFIKRKYNELHVIPAKNYYNTIKADTTENGKFNENLKCLESSTLIWLGTEFGVIAQASTN